MKKGILKKIDLAYERYSFYTIEVSKIARQVAFAEGAIFWALYFLMQSGPKPLIISFYSVLLLFFIFDLIQYVIGANSFEKEAEFMKKIIKSNNDKSLNYEIGDDVGKGIKKFYILKLVFIGISTLLLIFMFIYFIINNIPMRHCS